MKWSKQRHALLASGSLALLAAQAGCADTAVQSTPFPVVQAAQPSPEELDQIVAPIALYPDPLVAQILAASSYPADIVEAYSWTQQYRGPNSGELAQSLDQQAWDPSVKALAQFPSVLASMDKNLSWTSALGDAYDNEPEELLDAVQVMRRRAQEAGNLKGTPQETVTAEGQSIVIQPANPEVVYVPEYDPWLVYGAPLGAYPDWAEVPGVFVAGSSVLAGPGVEIGNFEGFGWGWGIATGESRAMGDVGVMVVDQPVIVPIGTPVAPPVPLVSRNAAWQFDPEAGLQEIVFRRIGENELAAIAACHALVSELSGASNEASGLLGALLDGAGTDTNPVLFHGYYFRTLTNQAANVTGGATGRSSKAKLAGSFVFTAYPAAYRASGVKTFIVNQDDVVYKKELGPETAKLARAMTEHHPDSTWTRGETEP